MLQKARQTNRKTTGRKQFQNKIDLGEELTVCALLLPFRYVGKSLQIMAREKGGILKKNYWLGRCAEIALQLENPESQVVMRAETV